MIAFDTPIAHFNYRVAGIALWNDYILLCSESGQDSWQFLMPGCPCSLLETSENTLIREMHYQLGVRAEIERLVWIVESFSPWTSDRYYYHMLSLYYLITFPHEPRLFNPHETFMGPETGGSMLMFNWHSIDELEKIDLYPEFLRTKLQHIPDAIQHFVVRG